MNSAQDVIDADLEQIRSSLKSEFASMAGKRLLIVGGAGFLGYNLAQSVLHWNRTGGGEPIRLTVYDNYIRGVPGLGSSDGDSEIGMPWRNNGLSSNPSWSIPPTVTSP